MSTKSIGHDIIDVSAIGYQRGYGIFMQVHAPTPGGPQPIPGHSPFFANESSKMGRIENEKDRVCVWCCHPVGILGFGSNQVYESSGYNADDDAIL